MRNSVYMSLALLVLVAPAEATTITVPGQQPTIQAALNACSPGDTVLVAPGTYLENIVWPATQGIYLKSEAGPEATIIDGSSPAQPDTGTVVLFAAAGVDESTVLEGFTITRGTGTYEPVYGSYGGGGILCDSVSPTIASNLIVGNTERIDVGGGIACVYDGAPVIRGNTISNNAAIAPSYGVGGGIFSWMSSPTIIDNVIADNEALEGGGVRVAYGAAIVSANEIARNRALFVDYGGGGIEAAFDSSTIERNTISDNRAERGGGIRLWESAATVTDNDITGNSVPGIGGGIQAAWSTSNITINDIIGNMAYSGGGISYHFSSDAKEDAGSIQSWVTVDPQDHIGTRSDGYIAGNTIVENTGGGILCSAGSPIIERCQILDNTGGGIACTSGATPEVHFNDIAGHTLAYGLSNSQLPEVKAQHNWWGHASGPFHPTTNPNGLGDRVSDYVDYTPWSATSGIAGPVPDVPRGQLLLAQNRPNPFHPTTEISYSVPGRTLLSLRIYDVDGRMLRTLVDGVAEPGDHTVPWDGRDASGVLVPSGVYYYRLAADGFEVTRAMAMVK